MEQVQDDGLIWRPATADDLSRIVAIASSVHPDHPEAVAVFAERLALYGPGCFVLTQAGMTVGYVLSHPWMGREPPKLDTMLSALPERPDRMVLHDLALLPQARGGGAGAAALALIAGQASKAGLPLISLVALPASRGFWERMRFHPDPNAPDLRSYGQGARLMHKNVRPSTETGPVSPVTCVSR